MNPRLVVAIDSIANKVSASGASAPTFVSAGTAVEIAAADVISVDLPSGLADGDYALCVVASADVAFDLSSFSVGSFDELKASGQGVIAAARLYGSPVGAADSSATVDITLQVPVTTAIAVFLIYRGAAATDPDFTATTKANSAAITQPGVTSTGVGLVVNISYSSVATGTTPPASWTEGLDVGTVTRLMEDHKEVTAGVVAADSRTQVAGDWVTIEGVLYP